MDILKVVSRMARKELSDEAKLETKANKISVMRRRRKSLLNIKHSSYAIIEYFRDSLQK